MTKHNKYIFALLFLSLSVVTSYAGVNVNINIGDQGHRDYYNSLSDFYRVDNDDIYYLRKRGIDDERLPVILQIASLANVPPREVARRYGPGVTLIELTRIFGLTPEIYYVPVKVRVDGPPYGKAYGYYRNRARKQWKDIYLDDHDIINLSNLRFMSGYYGVDPDVIIKKRSSGKNFIVINDDIYHDKKSKHNKWENKNNDNYHGSKAYQNNNNDSSENKDHGNAKGKEKSKAPVKGNGKAKGHNK